MLRRALTLLLGLAMLAVLPAVAVAATPLVALHVALGDDAHLGASTSMSLTLHVDPSLPPVNEFRLLLPAGVELASSGLGVTACRRPAAEIARVWNPVTHNRCPTNSLIGTGSATAGLLLDPTQTIWGGGFLELHAGASVDDKPGLLVTVDTYNPARLQLTYAGYLYVPPAPFGLGLAIKVPQIPRPPLGAPIALSTLSLAVGGAAITYHHSVNGRSVAYHPGGIPLPDSCVAGALRFRVILRFADGVRRHVDAVVACPAAR